jgi:hypothetical protein
MTDDLEQAFRGPFGLCLLGQLYSRRVTDGTRVLQMVEFKPIPDDFRLYDASEERPEDGLPNTSAELGILAELFMRHLTRYLTGTGYPDHATYKTLIPAERRKAAADDRGFRGRHFLHQMTGMASFDAIPSKLTVR